MDRIMVIKIKKSTAPLTSTPAGQYTVTKSMKPLSSRVGAPGGEEVTILITAMMEAIMMMEMKEEKEEIMMMTMAREEVEITINPEKGREAEAGAVMLDQGGADLGTEDQDTLRQYRRCRHWMPRNITGPETLLSFATTLKNGEGVWTPPCTHQHRQ